MVPLQLQCKIKTALGIEENAHVKYGINKQKLWTAA